LAVTNTLENSEVIVILKFGSDRLFASVISSLLISGPAEALVNHFTTQIKHQGQLLEQAGRELEEALKSELALYKEAIRNAERERHHLEGRFEQEKPTLNDEIHQLKERGVRGHEEERALNGGTSSPRSDRVFLPYPMRDPPAMLMVIPFRIPSRRS